MIVVANQRTLDLDMLNFRRRALRDVVICIGWLKLISVICYISLYYLVVTNSKGPTSLLIQIMILVTITMQILSGSIMFLGALDEKPLIIQIALWLCLILACHNTVLGAVGAIYFIRSAHFTIHFLLALLFALLAISLFTVLFHDILLLYKYKKLLTDPPPVGLPSRPPSHPPSHSPPHPPDRPPEVTADV